MGVNRFDAELIQLNNELEKNRREAEHVRADIVFFENFDEPVALKENMGFAELLRKKKEAFNYLQVQPINLPPQGFFDRIFDLAGSYKIQKEKVEDEHRRNKARLSSEISSLDLTIKAGQERIEKYYSLDEYQLRAMLRTYECREEMLLSSIQRVSAKRERLIQVVGPLLKDVAQYRQQESSYLHELNACQSFSQQLVLYSDDPVQRRQVHEACAEQFNGNGRPADVAYELNKQLQATQQQISKLEDLINRAIGNIESATDASSQREGLHTGPAIS
ncbi:hypothetical protein J1779_02390 [Rahnella sp. FC061912-K]|uniref:hypothetical protein n=1 Tax=Rahnella rivi TaxID=2816249 RepID=UPI001C25B01D|nr:hypothetical protein [Rahnella rivi]MBU9828776.1 hypothetical protein [Rahnella rivi]